MKKFAVVVLIIIFILLLFVPAANADPFSIMDLSSVAYAMQSSFGFNFFPENATASGITNVMSNQISDYINQRGGTISSLFGSEAARLAAGKIVVGQQMVNGIIDFTNWIIDKFGLDEDSAKISKGFIGDIEIDVEEQFDESGSIAQIGYDATFSGSPPYAQYGRVGYNSATIYLDGESLATIPAGTSRYYPGGWYIGDGPLQNYFYFNIPYWRITNSFHPNQDVLEIPGNIFRLGLKSDYILTNIMTASLDPDASVPDAINPGWVWEGDMDGWTGPDTNIGDFYDELLDNIIAGDINIDGEIVEDQPVPPEPTPLPIDPNTPLQDVPWEGLNDLIDTTNQQLENIDEIFSSGIDTISGSLDNIDETFSSGIDTISGQLDEVNEQIGEQTDTITESIEGTTEAVESLTETIEDVFDTPSTQEISQFKFDLRELFPFCIPFDIYRLLRSFDAEPISPHVQFPFVIDSLNFSYNIDLDFSVFDPVAQVLRTVEFIAYAIGLAWATGKVIKW